MKKLLLLLTGFVLLIAACTPDEPTSTTTNVTLDFKGKFNQDNLVMYQYYPTANGDSFYLNVLHFYVSDIRLIKGNETVKIKDIAVLDFTKNHLDNSEKGETIVIEGVEAGSYSGIKLGIGVDTFFNQTLPADYAPGHPLANASEFWDWRGTYIFGKFEGRFKNNGGAETSYAYHPGDNAFYHEISFTKNINLTGGTDATIGFEIDFKDIFKQGEGFIDIEATNVSHTGPEDYWLVELLMQNLSNSFRLKD